MQTQNETTKIFPIAKYASLLLLVMIILNMAVFFGTRLFNGEAIHHDLTIKLDGMIPFIPVFSVIYLLAFAQWVIGYIVTATEKKSFCYKIFFGEIIAKVVTGITFLVFPTTMARIAVNGSDIFSWIVSWIYSIDTPDNLFPSIHCLESWIVLRAAMAGTKKKWYRICMSVMSILVILSTLFIKQHVIADVVSAILLGEIGMAIAGKAIACHSERKACHSERKACHSERM